MARKIKPVYFNEEQDARRLQFIKQLPNFSDWVKRHIDAELGMPEAQELAPGTLAALEKIISAKLAGLAIATPTDQLRSKNITDISAADLCGDVSQMFA